jgi:hypothetical protein
MKHNLILLFVSSLLILCTAACSYLPEEVDWISGVEVDETPNYISLKPTNVTNSKTGLLFYPGGLVDPHAYIRILQGLAIEGYPVVIVKVSANLAITNANKAAACKVAFPEVERWVLSGHSLGGAVACIDINKAPSEYVGLILMASYSSESSDLSDWDGTVLSLFGEKDGLATPEKIRENESLLPTGITVENLIDMPYNPTEGQTIYHQIDGGNHAQFGNYGVQDKDGIASITSAEQQTEVVDYISTFFYANDWQ